MTIKIELTTENLHPHEAGALAAFLLTLHPDAVTAALGSLGEVTGGGGPADLVTLSPAQLDQIKRQQIREGLEASGELGGTTHVMPAEAGAPLPDVALTAREQGMECPDEGCPHFGSPHSHPEFTADTPTLTPEQAFGAAQVTHSEAPDSVGVIVPDPLVVIPTLDAEGLPWDERIHSSNHKQSANGVWMKRRGVLPTIDAQVRAELRQTYPAPAPSLTAAQRTMQAAVSEGLIPSPPVSTAVPVPPAPTAVAVPAPPVAAPATDAPSATPQPSASANTPDSGANTGNTASATSAASPSNGPAEFQRVMQKLAGPTGYQPTGKVTLEQTNGIVAAMGLTGLADLLKNPYRIPEFEAQIDALAGAA